ncbi:MAG: ATP-binding protein [Haloarculaceae archaeon]
MSRPRDRFAPAVAPLVVGGVGVALGGLSLWFLAAARPVPFGSSHPVTPAAVLSALAIVLLGVFSVVLVGAGYWLATGQFETEDRWWIGFWTVLGLAGITGLVTLARSFEVVERGVTLGPGFVEELLLAGGGGALAGLLIGVATIRSNTNAERASRQRDTLLFLNELLRHNVLNGMQIVLAYADRVEERVDDERVHEDLAVIAERSESVVELVDNVRTLTQSVAGETRLHGVALCPLLSESVADARETFPAATITLDVDPGVSVVADDLLPAIFENLLANAVEHNDGPEPYVSVVATATDDRVVVRVADDGPGVPDERKDSCFEPGEQDEESVGQGLGLFLVETLVERYGGEVHVADGTGEWLAADDDPAAGTPGAVFRVALQRAD